MSAGTWAELTGVSGQTAVLWPGGADTMIVYCNAGTWNPISKRIEVIAQYHGWGNMRYVRYDAATNAWSFVNNIGTADGHGYDHYEVNPTNGDIYYRAYGYGTGQRIWRFQYGGPSWDNNLSTIPIHLQVATGTCWWTGSMTPAHGGQGIFLICDGDFNNVAGYDPVGDSWFTSSGPSLSGSGYHTVMAYSPIHNCAVWGGGSGAPRQAWRVNSDRTITGLTSCPANCSIGIYKGLFSCDPVSGNFLCLSGGNLFELDPTGSGTWTQLTGSRVPPAVFGSSGYHMIACEIPEHGVTAYIRQATDTGWFYLYKHAEA